MENYKQWMEQKLTSEDMDKLPKVVKPLTDEQIEGIRMNTAGDIKAFARAIERAHGII
jgi:hypothetical protein